MIWDDPWITFATDRSGPVREFCTTLPPPPPPTGVIFDCVRVEERSDQFLVGFQGLVRTRWSVAVLRRRLAGAWSAAVWAPGEKLQGVCILRPYRDIWLLESLAAVHGHGGPLMHTSIYWLWMFKRMPFKLGFQWELTGTQYLAAWWRGWLAAEAELQWGWIWRFPLLDPSGCSFCPSTHVQLEPPVFDMPTLIQGSDWSAVVSDSGKQDGMGIVLAYSGTVDWSVVAKKGAWVSLWMRAVARPYAGWNWTGEFVVVGLLNHWGPLPSLTWVTPEV